ncbi:PaaI family thioesterase [Zavarzinia sp. CC-PAN008]|uniref:PaaI family thioesterase n=1 Tax=Zavarzinia sp. CC-PAN008 TaxID=3243332 RepID=UPI003F7458DF
MDGGTAPAGGPSDAEMVARLSRRFEPCMQILSPTYVSASRAEQRVAIDFVATPQFCHSGNVVQGGFLTAMIDGTMAQAVLVATGLTLTPSSLEIKMTFLNPGRPGVLKAEAWVVRMGKSICFIEGKLDDADGNPVARASSTARLFPLPQRATAG